MIVVAAFALAVSIGSLIVAGVTLYRTTRFRAEMTDLLKRADARAEEGEARARKADERAERAEERAEVAHRLAVEADERARVADERAEEFRAEARRTQVSEKKTELYELSNRAHLANGHILELAQELMERYSEMANAFDVFWWNGGSGQVEALFQGALERQAQLGRIAEEFAPFHDDPEAAPDAIQSLIARASVIEIQSSDAADKMGGIAERYDPDDSEWG
jgi:hypothetical protein